MPVIESDTCCGSMPQSQTQNDQGLTVLGIVLFYTSENMLRYTQMPVCSLSLHDCLFMETSVVLFVRLYVLVCNCTSVDP